MSVDITHSFTGNTRHLESECLMGKLALCSRCEVKHPRPVGKRCTIFKVMATNNVERINRENTEETPGTSTNNGNHNDSKNASQNVSAHQAQKTVSNAEILEHLKAIAAQVILIETQQEHSRSDSVTSIPKRKWKSKKVRVSQSQLTESQNSLDISEIPSVVARQSPRQATISSVAELILVQPQVTTSTVTMATTTPTMPHVQLPITTAAVMVTPSIASTLINPQATNSPRNGSVVHQADVQLVTTPDVAQVVSQQIPQQTQFQNTSVGNAFIAQQPIQRHVQFDAQIVPVEQQNRSIAATQNNLVAQSYPTNLVVQSYPTTQPPLTPVVTYSQAIAPSVYTMSYQQQPHMASIPQVQTNATQVGTGQHIIPQTHQIAISTHGQEHILPHPGQNTQIPALDTLRGAAVDQQLVQARMQEVRNAAAPKISGESNCCIENKKKKKIDIPWPQDFVFVGPSRIRLTYEQLTLDQFTLGFLKIVQTEPSPAIRANMIEYLTALFHNVVDHGWAQVKGAHHVVLSNMEDGLLSWRDLKKCKKTRKSYLLTPAGQYKQEKSVKMDYSTNKVLPAPCRAFQINQCHDKEHLLESSSQKHVCAYCLYVHSRWFNHSEANCRTKQRAKNGKRTQQGS